MSPTTNRARKHARALGRHPRTAAIRGRAASLSPPTHGRHGEAENPRDPKSRDKTRKPRKTRNTLKPTNKGRAGGSQKKTLGLKNQSTSFFNTVSSASKKEETHQKATAPGQSQSFAYCRGGFRCRRVSQSCGRVWTRHTRAPERHDKNRAGPRSFPSRSNLLRT